MHAQSVRRHIVTALGFVAPIALSSSCGGGGDPLVPVAVSYEVDLAVGEFDLVSGDAVAGALAFPATGATLEEYLVVGQLATTSPDLSSPFIVRGQDTQLEPPTPSVNRPVSAAMGFHASLRRKENALAARTFGRRSSAIVISRPPPVVGDLRTFKVCANLDCDDLADVPATARFVGAHAAVFTDNANPAGGFSDADIAEIGNMFDDDLYPIAVDRFGAESDIDGNGVVIVLLSKQINALIDADDCDNGFISGFFFGADIAPGIATDYNNGEVFYGMVPDPSGTVSCQHTLVTAKRVLQVTFIHEFQHMISFNQHVLVRDQPSGEVLWLNEALSHLSEELAGLHYDSLSVDSLMRRFTSGNFANAYSYLRGPDPANAGPETSALISEEPPGSLESRGAGWLFIRWLLDQYGQDLSRTLVQSTQIGTLNVQSATGGTSIEELLGRWALSVYVSDLPGFTAPASLRYTTWQPRERFAYWNATSQFFEVDFPLEPHVATGTSTLVSGTINAGSGSYVLSTQAPGSTAFDLFFRRSNSRLFAASAVPQAAVIRLR